MIGQRRFTALSTAVLVVPLIWLGVAVQDPTTLYTVMVVIAALCGIGGANFASSLANIGFFFPEAEKGSATGVNGGLGMPFTLHGTPSPAPEQVAAVREVFRSHGLHAV
ncbi:hypothetical protein [Streptomyces roseolus]|uniref:hypothetical protein n=1 Tax=Streptomyces roseolus TaxID=67358 RepID=UPI00364C2640